MVLPIVITLIFEYNSCLLLKYIFYND